MANIEADKADFRRRIENLEKQLSAEIQDKLEAQLQLEDLERKLVQTASTQPKQKEPNPGQAAPNQETNAELPDSQLGLKKFGTITSMFTDHVPNEQWSVCQSNRESSSDGNAGYPADAHQRGRKNTVAGGSSLPPVIEEDLRPDSQMSGRQQSAT